MKVVEVLWGDAWVKTDDMSVKKARVAKPVMRTTVGFLVANNEDGLVLCTDRYEDDPDTINTPMLIPHGWIKDWWVYK